MDLTQLGYHIAVLGVDSIHNALAVMMTLRMLGEQIHPFFVGISAFFGAFSALALSIFSVSRWISLGFWLPIALVMAGLALGGRRWKRKRIAAALTLLACEGYLGGVVLALYGATGSMAAAHLISMVSAAVFFVGAGCMERLRWRIRHVGVICRIGEKEISFTAIVDSGNTLRDYLTHRPVIVAGAAILEALEGEAISSRPIFADTAGGRVMMQLVTPKEIWLEYSGRRRRTAAVLALSPALAKRAPALVPTSLLS